MSSRSAVVLVIFVVAVIAFCLAGVFATMTGTYHLNLDFGNNSTNNTDFFGNLSEFNSDNNSGSSSSGSSSVQTHSDKSSNSSSSVKTTEDTSQSSSKTPQESSSQPVDDSSVQTASDRS